MNRPDILVVSRPSYRGGTAVFGGDGKLLATGLGAIDAHVFVSALIASAGQPLTVMYAANVEDADRQYKAIFRDGARLGQAIARRKADEEAVDRCRRTFLDSIEELLGEQEPSGRVTVIELVPECDLASCSNHHPIQGGSVSDRQTPVSRCGYPY